MGAKSYQGPLSLCFTLGIGDFSPEQSEAEAIVS